MKKVPYDVWAGDCCDWWNSREATMFCHVFGKVAAFGQNCKVEVRRSQKSCVFFEFAWIVAQLCTFLEGLIDRIHSAQFHSKFSTWFCVQHFENFLSKGTVRHNILEQKCLLAKSLISRTKPISYLNIVIKIKLETSGSSSPGSVQR